MDLSPVRLFLSLKYFRALILSRLSTPLDNFHLRDGVTVPGVDAAAFHTRLFVPSVVTALPFGKPAPTKSRSVAGNKRR